MESGINFERIDQEMPQAYRTVLEEFRKIPRSYVRFQLLFLTLGIIESSLFFISIPLLSQTALLAIALATVFLTIFSYFLLLFYQQAKKPELLEQILDRLISSCRSHLAAPTGTSTHHLSVASSLSKLADYLEGYESELIKVPFFGFTKLSRKLSSISSTEDVFRFKQLLLTAAIEEHLAQIRIHPTDAEAHASLAISYVRLAQAYRSATTVFPKQAEELQSRFEMAMQRAQQEFQILKEFAPNDPWIHDQLANGYRELGLIDEELKELDELRKLRPKDANLFFRIGSLYFQRGDFGKGLQTYAILQKLDYAKGQELIRDYGRSSNLLTPVDF